MRLQPCSSKVTGGQVTALIIVGGYFYGVEIFTNAIKENDGQAFVLQLMQMGV